MKEAKGEGEVIVCTLGGRGENCYQRRSGARSGSGNSLLSLIRETIFRRYQIAKTIADAIRDENADLIFTGLQSDDASYGQTGVILAELLGIPHATIVIEVDRESLNGSLRVKRELKAVGINGLHINFRAFDDSIRNFANSLRQLERNYGGERKKKSAKFSQFGDFGSTQKIEKVYLPLKTKQTQILGDGDAKAGAVELVEKLKTEVRVILFQK